MNIFKKGSDIKEAGVDIVDLTVGAATGVSVVSQAYKAIRKLQAYHLAKKAQAFAEELVKSNTNRVLLAQALENLRQEFGKEYFDEQLFSQIDKADSTKRVAYLARLLNLVASGAIPMGQYWTVSKILNDALMQDLSFFPKLVEYERYRNAINGSDKLSELEEVDGDYAQEVVNDLYYLYRDELNGHIVGRIEALGVAKIDPDDAQTYEQEVYLEVVRSVGCHALPTTNTMSWRSTAVSSTTSSAASTKRVVT